MSTRPVHVYELVIIYPPGSRQPGWRPASWDDPATLAGLSRKQRQELRNRAFRWPHERRFLSSSGAYGRADLLRSYGADVEVYPSEPVTWDQREDRSAAFITLTGQARRDFENGLRNDF